MSSTIACTAPEAVLQCQLIQSGSYREQLTIAPIADRPHSFDVRVTGWLDNARHPMGRHVRYRTTLDHAALTRLHEALGALLQAQPALASGLDSQPCSTGPSCSPGTTRAAAGLHVTP
ncbi:hypothetical protein [Azohydromonas caseinilytica]|uniref:Uncharacterized protein n=1 Tax=Azohydromonas caseinilytica TaxID=2728836 RepID=A0A848FGF0_9BURK|nr:hypothetical protein [Azohydromonas caseinilytica]NML17333.1 hypothetical protein [Azohydromonas caseinilytica]